MRVTIRSEAKREQGHEDHEVEIAQREDLFLHHFPKKKIPLQSNMPPSQMEARKTNMPR